MSTLTITQRRIPVAIAAVAAAAVLTFAGLMVAQSDNASSPSGTSADTGTHSHGTFQSTTSGGQTQLSQP
jgi:Spy/CpxP family protein refolding chaperone